MVVVYKFHPDRCNRSKLGRAARGRVAGDGKGPKPKPVRVKPPKILLNLSIKPLEEISISTVEQPLSKLLLTKNTGHFGGHPFLTQASIHSLKPHFSHSLLLSIPRLSWCCRKTTSFVAVCLPHNLPAIRHRPRKNIISML